MLGEGPRFPFFPHLIGEENDEYVVHYDEGKRLAPAAKPPASSQIGKNDAPSRKNARGLHLGSALTDFRKSAGNFFAATTSNATTILERSSRPPISAGQ